MASANLPPCVGHTNEGIGEKGVKPAKPQRRTPYIRWFGISHPELPPAGTAPTALEPMVNPVPVALGISPDNKTKRIRNPRVHLINAARIEPLDPGREAILISLTAYTKEPVPSYEVGKITFWFSITIPYRKDLLIQLRSRFVYCSAATSAPDYVAVAGTGNSSMNQKREPEKEDINAC
ncbi:hypothetical protein Q9L58_002374 [Maublancomyces gigas]|uniref:Uncharacterized protein n=1 Tax=Discina gigas TaxID=1032678 RepID=A0ABR3GRV3_9PEZI